jgi:hypothetical protein
MSIYYPTGNCGAAAALPPYACSPCLDREFGRIRKLLLYKEGHAPTDFTSTSQWQALLAAGNAIFLWKVNGEYDGGETEEIDGFGDVEKENGSTTHKAVIRDPYVKDNHDWANAIKDYTNWIPVLFTSSRMWDAGEPCSIKVKAPIENNLKSVMTYEYTLTWSSPDLPTPHAIPAGIFDSCFIVEQ